ncbi:hypothetical protein CBOM_00838 [Ceraceosorus bombacis]|uniref:Uncharacterized protein n=1 Tax=Ceraceosorus bombacis TaxID=401625 RepID=A0A0P1BB55_9BASI|nr:hypothetical protein CBOM_00838 [Ceraceosorus bombacis]
MLILVRPPPSKQSNPLNLQIQLVTPLTQSGSGSRVSGELSREDSVMSGVSSNGQPGTPSSSHGVRRSNSMSSQRSGRSEVSSGGMSTSSSTGASRRVTPLYNLFFHSLLPTTVSDAGNDQKIAKFGRKGVEIDGFGQLEPRELIPGDPT